MNEKSHRHGNEVALHEKIQLYIYKPSING